MCPKIVVIHYIRNSEIELCSYFVLKRSLKVISVCDDLICWVKFFKNISFVFVGFPMCVFLDFTIMHKFVISLMHLVSR